MIVYNTDDLTADEVPDSVYAEYRKLPVEQRRAFRRALVECCQSETLADYVLSIENRLRLAGSRTAVFVGSLRDDYAALVNRESGEQRIYDEFKPVNAQTYRLSLRQGLTRYGSGEISPRASRSVSLSR